MTWHGYSTPTANLHIGKLPGRKRAALYTIDENGALEVLARFASDWAAKTTLAILDQWILPPEKSEEEA